MSCTQNLFGINNDCTPTKGGIVEVYIHEYDSDMFYYDEELNEEEITSLLTNKEWYLYQFKKNTGSMTSTLNVDQANGINFVETELTLVFGKMSTEKLIEINALSKSELSIIVKDCNGKYYALGMNNPVTVSSSTGQTGTQFTDGNNYTITFTDQCNTFPFLIKEEIAKEIEDRLKYGVMVNDAYFYNLPSQVSYYREPNPIVDLAISPYDADREKVMQLQFISSDPNAIKFKRINYAVDKKRYTVMFDVLPIGEPKEVTIKISDPLTGKIFSTDTTTVVPH